MNFPRYPNYKESGVDWLGRVPAHWELKRLKCLCTIQTGSRDTEDAIENGGYPFFVRSQSIERIDSYAFDCEAVLTAGDGAGVGKVFHYHPNGPFDFHQRVYMLNCFREVSGKFVFNYLKENFYKVALEGGAKSTVDSLRRPMFTNFPVAVPPAKEQDAILKFIARESAQIDILVAQQQRLIELLIEKRQATLGHLLRDSPVRIIVLNGRSVVTQFEEVTRVSLDEREMSGWALRRGGKAVVPGYSYKGYVSNVAGVTLDRALLVLGYRNRILAASSAH